MILTARYAIGSISTADGSALVRMGDTTIVCGVKAEIAEPELDRPEHGFLGMCTQALSNPPILTQHENADFGGSA